MYKVIRVFLLSILVISKYLYLKKNLITHKLKILKKYIIDYQNLKFKTSIFRWLALS